MRNCFKSKSDLCIGRVLYSSHFASDTSLLPSKRPAIVPLVWLLQDSNFRQRLQFLKRDCFKISAMKFDLVIYSLKRQFQDHSAFSYVLNSYLFPTRCVL